MNMTKLSVTHNIYATPLLVTEENVARLSIIYGTCVLIMQYGVTNEWWLECLLMAAYLRAQVPSLYEHTHAHMYNCSHKELIYWR